MEAADTLVAGIFAHQASIMVVDTLEVTGYWSPTVIRRAREKEYRWAVKQWVEWDRWDPNIPI